MQGARAFHARLSSQAAKDGKSGRRHGCQPIAHQIDEIISIKAVYIVFRLAFQRRIKALKRVAPAFNMREVG